MNLLRFTCLLCFFTSFSVAQVLHPLSLKFEGLEPQKGQVMLRVFDEKEDVIKELVLPVRDLPLAHQIELPAGRYAISCFYDRNQNQKLDRKFTGFPAEPYAFSNNVRGTFGPPDFADQLFTLNAPLILSLRLE